MNLKLSPIPSKEFTADDEAYLRKVMGNYCEKKKLFIVSSQTIGSPFRAIYINSDEARLLLMNPKITKIGEGRVNSQEVSEYDTLRKARVVPRATYIEVQSDNLGLVVFEGDLEEKKSGLNECIMVQQMIDLLDGVTVRDRNVNRPIVVKKYDRNQLVMVKSPSNTIEQMKYKNVEPLLSKGYTIL